MKNIIFFTILSLMFYGCASVPRGKVQYVPQTAAVSKVEAKVKSAKEELSVIKNNPLISADKDLSNRVSSVERELEDALVAAAKAKDEIERITKIANDNFVLYVEKEKEFNKLEKKVKYAKKENWLWRLLFISLLIYLTRKIWLRLLGISL
jgi:PBP1b-binding outer membrane lipoprotein LpoB